MQDLRINKIPGGPKTKDVPGLGKDNATNIIDTVNKTDTTRGFLRFFETKARLSIKIAIGMTKYCPPPHDANANPTIIPLKIAFGIKYL